MDSSYIYQLAGCARFDAVVVADGDMPSHPLPLAIMAETPLVVACDAAGEHMQQLLGVTPDAVIGDADSMSAEFASRHAGIIHRVDEQDYNDLTKATRFCIARNCRHIAYVGCTGKRDDHTMGNISLMAYYMRELGIVPVMITDYGTFVTAGHDTTLPTFKGQQISIFNLTCTRLSGTGLRWQPYAFGYMWQGTLNEATADSITLSGDGHYMVYLTHEAKKRQDA